ncbi:MAG: phage holin family protein [Janthinobacterium lividum]
MAADRGGGAAEDSALLRLSRSLLSLAGTRLEIASIELREELEFVLAVMFSGFAALLFALLSLSAFSVLLVAACWQSYRWQSLLALGVVYALLSVACVVRARHRLQRTPEPFGATLAELQKDANSLDSH